MVLMLVIVAACSASCSAQSTLPQPSTASMHLNSYEALKAHLVDVRSVDILSFKRACFECRQSGLRPQDLDGHTTSSRLSAEKTLELIKLLSQPTSFILNLSKPCAEFYPSIALRFSGVSASMALLLYPSCKTARLVRPDGRDLEVLNIDPIADELDRILPIPWRTQ